MCIAPSIYFDILECIPSIASIVVPSFAALPVPPAFAAWLAGILPECGSAPWFHAAASAEHPAACARVLPVDVWRSEQSV